MTTEQPKAAPGPQEHAFPPIAPFYNSNSFPPPLPPYFYPPHADGNHGDANAPNGAPPGPPYMMAYPPGMVYAYPPLLPHGFPQAQASPPVNRPKRKQVKMACTNCAAACKRCDEARPCERCVKYGISESCVDGQRKERKKGVKRGPYKRKNKGNDPAYTGYSPPADGEWSPNSTPQAPNAAGAPPVHPGAPYAPEGGYFPYFYPPYMPAMHEGQPGPDGSPPHANPQTMVPYYLPGYPPPFPYPGYPMPPPPPPQPPTLDPADTTKKPENGAEAGNNSLKRKTRGSKTESKTKKAKTTTAQPTQADNAEGGSDDAQITSGDIDAAASKET